MKWTLELKDLFSGAAKKAASAADRLQSSLSGVRKASARVDDALERADKKAKKSFAGEAMGKGFSVMKGLAVNAISAGASALVSLGHKAAQTLGGVVQGAMGKEAVLKGMAAILGGADKAKVAFDRIAKKAAEMGMGTLDAAKQAQGLLAMGFSMDGSTGVLKVLEAGQALKAINPTANVDNVITALSQIKAKGKLTAEELHGQLGDAGVNVGYVYDELAKKLGKSTDEVRKMMAAGKITSDMGIEAVFASIERQGGASMEKLAAMGKGSLGNVIERLMNLPQEIGARADLSGLMAGAAAGLDKIVTMLSDPKTVGFMEAILGSGAKALDKMIPAAERVIGVLTDPRAAAFFDGLVNVAGELITGLGEGFAAAADVMLGADTGNMENLAVAAKAVGQALGAVIGVAVFSQKILAGLADAVGALISGLVWLGESTLSVGAIIVSAIGSAGAAVGAFFVGIGEWIAGAATALWDGAMSLGTNIIDGIIGGIDAGLSAVVDSIVGVATSAIKAAEDVLGIASPSKVFTGIGLNLSESMGGGVDAGADTATSATANMASSAAAAGQGAARAVTWSRSSESRSTTISAPIYISGAQDPKATGSAVRAELQAMQDMQG